jgi:hypothetical protein
LLLQKIVDTKNVVTSLRRKFFPQMAPLVPPEFVMRMLPELLVLLVPSNFTEKLKKIKLRKTSSSTNYLFCLGRVAQSTSHSDQDPTTRVRIPPGY